MQQFSYHSLGYDEDVYVKIFEKHMNYKLNKGRWRPGDMAMDRGWFCSSSSCVIETMLYSLLCGMIKLYVSKEKYWKYLKGLAKCFGLHRYIDAKMTGNGGKLAIMWETIMYNNECQSSEYHVIGACFITY
ncbi:putative F-box/kelch-repeat protein [Cardamine amara subsp. amara]|uniref:F-box/kelch-repeat protein n=1 Tax=Cardamine amara subsp. amara TaxID=228776 RepID=A0ABD1A883_CARAN